MPASPARYARRDLQKMEAYAVENANGMIKLDALENPFAPPPETISLWQQQLHSLRANRYPDPHQSSLRAKIADRERIDPQQLLFGNGSDELIQLLMLACCEASDRVMALEPGFVMYKMAARYSRTRYHGVLLSDDFTIDENRLLRAIDSHKPKILFIASPNNPTGNAFDRQILLNIISHSAGLVVIDEAYSAFCGSSHAEWLNGHDNLILLKTFSKTGLAGLRLGYLIAHPSLVAEINKARMPYNISAATQLLMAAALETSAFFDQQIKRIIEQRQWLAQQLQQLACISTVFPSVANFLLMRCREDLSATHINQHLKRAGILVKNLDQSHLLLHNCLRVSIGQEGENQKIVEALKRYEP